MITQNVTITTATKQMEVTCDANFDICPILSVLPEGVFTVSLSDGLLDVKPAACLANVSQSVEVAEVSGYNTNPWLIINTFNRDVRTADVGAICVYKAVIDASEAIYPFLVIPTYAVDVEHYFVSSWTALEPLIDYLTYRLAPSVTFHYDSCDCDPSPAHNTSM